MSEAAADTFIRAGTGATCCNVPHQERNAAITKLIETEDAETKRSIIADAKCAADSRRKADNLDHALQAFSDVIRSKTESAAVAHSATASNQSFTAQCSAARSQLV